jgi:hypothetical protein
VEKLIDRDLQSTLLERLYGRHCVAVFNTGDVASEKTRPLFYVALGKVFLFTQSRSLSPTILFCYSVAVARSPE